MGADFITVIFIAVFGLAVGSFLNACIYRLPLGRSIVLPNSRCPDCGNRLSFSDLIPVLSFVFLKGRCRYCDKKISIRYPLVELLASFISVLIFTKTGFRAEILFYLAFSYALIVLFFSDLETQIMPDSVNVFIIMLGLAHGIVLGIREHSVLENIFYFFIGMAACAAVMYSIYLAGRAIYKREALGGGDIKFGIALGAFFGWKFGLLSIFISYMVGAVYSLFLLASKLKTREQEIPFGPAMVMAAFIVMLFGSDILAWYLRL